MTRLQFIGTNYDEVKELLGDRVLAPYFCIGLTMLSVLSDSGFITVNEGDWIVLDEDGSIRVE